ncbi:helix-turn-helix transcriptional regulator [Brachybacterium squillarum]|uniref:helix-turn-helix transcriptional regulator n=1 Tax=Brachybacterium squillarum TaxID=661979 RepID=UPI002222A114|nr:helix-turn-helix transcriptional regulator [Brachybacterium squillarum]MCW1805274.1 helix-turn-helix domain-containing protein [Brachybacterium squillarum]
MELINRDKLVRRMESLGVSQRELARAAGWKSHSYMRRLITGDASTLNTDPALRIAHYLHLDVDDIFVTRVDSQRAQSEPVGVHRRRKTAA